MDKSQVAAFFLITFSLHELYIIQLSRFYRYFRERFIKIVELAKVVDVWFKTSPDDRVECHIAGDSSCLTTYVVSYERNMETHLMHQRHE